MRTPLPVGSTQIHIEYAVNFPSFVRIFGGKAFEQGSAYSIGGFSGAALWLPPGVHPDEESTGRTDPAKRFRA